MKFLPAEYYDNGVCSEMFINVDKIISIWPTGENFCTVYFSPTDCISLKVKKEDLATLGIYIQSWAKEEGLMP